MARRDWRTRTYYDGIEDFTPRELAWEYLRRNPDFKREQRRAPKAGSDPDLADSAAQTWGLRFRGRPKPRLATDGGVLVADRRPGRHRPNGIAPEPCAPAA